MAKAIQSIGTYSVKETGAEVEYGFEYQAFDSMQDAINSLGETECLALVQRMTKVDANNTAREKAKVANGHSARKPMSEAEKAQAKLDRTANKSLLQALRAKGIKSLEDLQGLLD